MIKNLIIGSGYSAAITKLLIGKNSKVVGVKKFTDLNKKIFLRRESLDVNKLFLKKITSYGSLKFKLNYGKMHDRLNLGGNSSIWGGHINLKKIPTRIIKLLKSKVKFLKLSYNETGNTTNDKNIHQLQTFSGNILSSKNLLKKIDNGFISSFFIRNKKIYIRSINLKNNRINQIKVDRLFLCIGTIQFLDLLYRSNILKEKDTIEFSEFYHKYKINNIYSEFPKKNIVLIRYKLSRAIGHYLGIQFFSKLLKLLNFIPLCIDQCFYKKKINYKLQLKNGEISEKNVKKFVHNFGQSIHYCNLRINKIPINQLLKKIHPNIYGIGMPFVDQDMPGPISNDILLDAVNKIRNM